MHYAGHMCSVFTYLCYVYVFAEFNIRLTSLKEIPITLKSHRFTNTGDENIDGIICKYIIDS